MHLDVLAAVGYGDWVSWWKSLPFLAVFLLWLRLITWADKDSQDAHLPRMAVNLASTGVLVLALLLVLVLPNFALALLAFVGLLLVSGMGYLFARHQTVGLADLSKDIKNALKGKAKKQKEITAGEGEVLLTFKNKPIVAPDDEAPERLGYDALQAVLNLPMRKGADRIEVVPTQDGNSILRYHVDGYPYVARTMSRNEAGNAIAYMKLSTGQDLNDRRRPQTSNVRLTDKAGKHDAVVTTAGSSTGEQMVVELDIARRYDFKVDELGFSEDQLKTIQESAAGGRGIVLAAAPKGQGLTALMYGLLRAHDAFVHHIQTVERDPPIELEGITQNKLTAASTNAEELKLVSWVVSNEPDVVMVGRVEEPRAALELIKLAESGKRIYIGLRAGSTFEALSQWRKLVGDDRAALGQLEMVIAGRVVRKLCMACKVAYTPDPDALRKMNLNPEKASKLFQARTQPLRDPKGNEMPCEFCGDLRFKGRVGIYELLVTNDEVRQAVLGGASVDQLKALFRKQRRRYLQEMALARVEAGDTSIQEVLRVLRGEQPSGSGKSPASASA
jgi:type II secretory ATPase GspE/PulE/Tfp pilus assembly ATPase PilB-like protein